MHPATHARARPDHPAIRVAGTGEIWTYDQLDRASNRVAQLFRARGLGVGDTVALCLDNRPDYLAIAWGAQRAGLALVAVSTRLTAAEAAYIVADSGARMMVAGPGIGPLFDTLLDACGVFFLSVGRDWDEALATMPDTPVADERAGTDMLYSSGTTGRPKGIRLPLPEDPAIDGANSLAGLAQMAFGFGEDTVYLSPAPLYHAAPLRWCMTTHRLGGTVVLMEKFEPTAALTTIERHRVTHGQFVPTHFVRLLKLSDEARAAHDVSSLRVAIHAAAPCPLPVKRAMIDWWGPVLAEYYAGTEGNGLTLIGSADWLAHEGSVGKAVIGELHVCDEAGRELPAGEEGLVYFGGAGSFEYHNDPDKTASVTHPQGWTTLGDVGRVDDDGYLYLTDRADFMIISGGVNVYPQEVEDLLVTHPLVADVAVVGAPHPDLGEQVVAAVRLSNPAGGDAALEAEMIAWVRARLSGVKTPRRIEFVDELPRAETGKLYKRLIRDRYRANGVPPSRERTIP